MFKIKILILLLSLTFILSTICPDNRKTTCGDDLTCCKYVTGVYGCCPYKEAVCCSDGLHCCPTGYECSANNSSCSRKSGLFQIAEIKHVDYNVQELVLKILNSPSVTDILNCLKTIVPIAKDIQAAVNAFVNKDWNTAVDSLTQAFSHGLETAAQCAKLFE